MNAAREKAIEKLAAIIWAARETDDIDQFGDALERFDLAHHDRPGRRAAFVAIARHAADALGLVAVDPELVSEVDAASNEEQVPRVFSCQEEELVTLARSVLDQIKR